MIVAVALAAGVGLFSVYELLPMGGCPSPDGSSLEALLGLMSAERASCNY
ncbi:MAG TPA: hypothetical protein VK126_05970 [Nitrososphaerales archaeon]|nr:hypothetical protein [Nitrososphaerales archaeon]